MAKKRQSPSRAERVAVGVGTALGRLQAKLDRLNREGAAVPGFKAALKRAQSMLSAIGPNTSGDQAKPRRATKKAAKKAAKKSTKPQTKVSTVRKAASKGPKRATKRRRV